MVVIVVLLAAGTGLVYWLGVPRLQDFSPADGASALPAGTQIRLTFSQSMQPETVIQRLEIDPARPGGFTWEESSSQPDRILVFTPEQPWDAGVTVRVTLLHGARSAGPFAPAMRQRASWSFRIRQPELAYLYPSSGPSANIYVLNPLSGASTLLTQNMGVVQDFSVNTSGSAIYYSSRTGMDSSALFRLDLALPDPSTTTQGTATPDQLPANTQILHCPKALCRAVEISPDGKHLAYERTAFPGSGSSTLPQVWVLPLDTLQGKMEPEPFLAGDPAHETLQPAWSPQGLLTFYDRTVQAFIIADMQSGSSSAFPTRPANRAAGIPMDGSLLPLKSSLPAFRTPRPWRTATSSLSTGRPKKLRTSPQAKTWKTPLLPSLPMATTWPSPENSWMCSAGLPAGKSGFCTCRAGNSQQMTDEPDYNHFNLAWSPAGDQLAYVRFNQTTPTEPPEIWLMDPLTGRAIQIVIGGFSPQWIP